MAVLEEGLRNIDAAPGFQCSYISTGNCSTTPLAGGATFTGEAEKTAHTDLLVYSYSDVAGTLYVDGALNNNISFDPQHPLQVGEKSAIWIEAATTIDNTSVAGRMVLTVYNDPAS